MAFLGFVLVSKRDYEILTECRMKNSKIHECRRWFAGWIDLDVIWDYLLGDGFAHVEDARKEYAAKRKTDVYGQNRR